MSRLTTDRVARHLHVALIENKLPLPALELARNLLQDIDSGQRIKGLESCVRGVIEAGFRCGALAVADATSPRGVKTAVAGIKATAALSATLGLNETPVATTETHNHTPSIEPADIVKEAAS